MSFIKFWDWLKRFNEAMAYADHSPIEEHQIWLAKLEQRIARLEEAAPPRSKVNTTEIHE